MGTHYTPAIVLAVSEVEKEVIELCVSTTLVCICYTI